MNPDTAEAVPDEELEREAMDARPPIDDGTGVDLCPGCLHSLPFRGGLCPECGTRGFDATGIAPWQGLQSQKGLYRYAVETSRKPVIFFGAWLIFLPNLIAAGMLIVWEGRWVNSMDLFFLLLRGVVSLVVLTAVTQSYFRRPQTVESNLS